MNPELLYEQEEGLVTLTLNRPELRNSISSPALIELLVSQFDRINQDQGVKVAILTGSGTAFCSGGDLNNMYGLLESRRSRPSETPSYYTHGVQRISEAFAKLEVPIIAAINGPAIGGGLDIACMCDIRIAASSARFSENYIRLGLVSGMGGYWYLPRIVGYSKACEMAMTGMVLTADQAAACGLVTSVVDDRSLMAEAKALALRMASHSPEAIRNAKRFLKEAESTSLSAHLQNAAATQSILHTSDSHRAALEEFVNRRRQS